MKKCRIGLLVTLMLAFGLKSSAQLQPGVVISLDDHYVADWVKADSIFYPKYNWRVTFFVAGFGKIKPELQQQLLVLQSKGHEIGYHGTSHVNATDYLKTHTLDQYITDDFTQLQPMRAMGLRVTSFAYPSGGRNAETDSALLKRFTMLRGVTNNKTAEATKNCFYQNKPLVAGIGMEYHYKYFTKKYLLKLLDYARKHKTVLILYSHKPVETADPRQHQVDYDTLNTICQYVISHHMKFYTMNELAKYNKP